MTRSHRTGRRLQVLAGVLAALISSQTPLFAQSVSAAALKAAFLYNFVKFTDWPSDSLAPGQKLLLCITGDDAVADGLQQTIKAHPMIGEHEVTAHAVNADDKRLRSCHLLYVGGLYQKGFIQVLEGLKGVPVFTVSDRDAFTESGGVAQLILENDHVRFAVNPMAAERARLRISSKLLTLARIVKDAG